MKTPERGTIEIYRCVNCHKLLNYFQIMTRGSCSCGSKRVSGASPGNLYEYLKCWWWSLTL